MGKTKPSGRRDLLSTGLRPALDDILARWLDDHPSILGSAANDLHALHGVSAQTSAAPAPPTHAPDLLAEIARMMEEMPRPIPLVLVTTELPTDLQGDLTFMRAPEAGHFIKRYYPNDVWCAPVSIGDRDLIFCSPEQARRMHLEAPLILRRTLSPCSALYDIGIEPRPMPLLPPFSMWTRPSHG